MDALVRCAKPESIDAHNDPRGMARLAARNKRGS